MVNDRPPSTCDFNRHNGRQKEAESIYDDDDDAAASTVVARDRAAHWISRAAKAGLAPAQTQYGRLLQNWFLDPSVSGDSTLHASFMMSSYHETEEMTAAEAAETLETLVRWSE